jgi:hypothetical protein
MCLRIPPTSTCPGEVELVEREGNLDRALLSASSSRAALGGAEVGSDITLTVARAFIAEARGLWESYAEANAATAACVDDCARELARRPRQASARCRRCARANHCSWQFQARASSARRMQSWAGSNQGKARVAPHRSCS